MFSHLKAENLNCFFLVVVSDEKEERRNGPKLARLESNAASLKKCSFP